MKRKIILSILIALIAVIFLINIGCTDTESRIEKMSTETRDKTFNIILDSGEEAEGPVTFSGYYEAMKFDGSSSTMEVEGDTPQEYSIEGVSLYCNLKKESRYGVLRARVMIGDKVVDEAQTTEENGKVIISTTIHHRDYK